MRREGYVSPCASITPFLDARGDSKVRVKCQYTGNEVFMLETAHKLFVPMLWRVYLTSICSNVERPITPPIAIPRACKVMIVKLES